ncbi:hypothetical protein B296_00057296 [Ensete ventricosum]|uniref:Uncharacterized protein n=1 Tax=Ensete ventricosum TaxID=4639 RepID=A0A426WWH0_ENSVE|nr:hypothetical protein B296_00057296 [Ensete ventricosum]
MRLNCVESFYAFFLHFCSKHSEERGQPTTVRSYVGLVGHDLATCKGVADCGQGPLQRGDRLGGWQPLAGTTAYSATSARGGRQRPARKGKLLAATLKRATPTASPQGAAAHGQGCRQGGDDSTIRVREEG